MLYSYRDNPVRFDDFSCWWDKYNEVFAICFVEYQNDLITEGFNLLRNDYDVVTYDFIYSIYDNNRNRVFLSLYSIKWYESFCYIVTAITIGKWFCWIGSYLLFRNHIRYVWLSVSIGYETILLLFNYDFVDPILWKQEQSIPISVFGWIIFYPV